MISRVVFFFDGFNLYHALNANYKYHKYKWLNLTKLAQCFITKNEKIEEILYFTALANWSPDKVKRHKILIKALEINNVKVIYGEFKRKDKYCTNCHKNYKTYEEKQTDVNIAIKLFELAIQDRFDTAIIVSGDSDLLPSIAAVKRNFPQKKIGVVIPIGRRADALKNNCDYFMKMKEKHLRSSLFDLEININNQNKLICPTSWR